jgi:hypothetical protein
MKPADALLFFLPLSIEIDGLCSLSHAAVWTLQQNVPGSVQH